MHYKTFGEDDLRFYLQKDHKKIWVDLQNHYPILKNKPKPCYVGVTTSSNTMRLNLGWKPDVFMVLSGTDHFLFSDFKGEMKPPWVKYRLFTAWMAIFHGIVYLHSDDGLCYIEKSSDGSYICTSPAAFIGRDIPYDLPITDKIYRELESSTYNNNMEIVWKNFEELVHLAPTKKRAIEWIKRYPVKYFDVGILLEVFEFSPPTTLFSKFKVRSE